MDIADCPLGIGGSKYYLILVDDYSRYSAIYPMKAKDEATHYFRDYHKAMENIHNNKLIYLRCDNAQEFVEGPLAEYASEQGITYERSVPDAHQQNGVAERHNATFCTMARAMLLDAHLSEYFWPLAIQAAVFTKNRLPHHALPLNTSPYELYYGDKPDISLLRPFGAHCTARILRNKQPKFAPHAERGRFVGYPRNSAGYLFWHPDTRTVKVRRDLAFLSDSPQPSFGDKSFDYSAYTPLWTYEVIPQNNTIEEATSKYASSNNTILLLLLTSSR